MNTPSGPKLCPACSLLSVRSAERCDCGYNFSTGASGATAGTDAGARYSSLWRRFCAAFLDNVVLGLVWVPVIVLAVPDVPNPQPADLPGWFTPLFLASWWLYYALQESSRHQATIGKRAFGLLVAGADGSKLSFAVATGRCFAKVLSNMTFGLGYLMAVFTKRQQALHDLLAGTVVTRRV